MQLIPCGCKANEAMYSVGQFSGGKLQSSTKVLHSWSDAVNKHEIEELCC